MQRELEANGLNPNPMYFWKYVKTKSFRTAPCVAVFGKWDDELTRLAESRPEIRFRYETFEMNDNMPSMRNVLVVFLNWTAYSSWVRERSNVDYLFCNENNRDIQLQSQLCGVRCVSSIEELEKELENAHALTPVERIENWELAKEGLA